MSGDTSYDNLSLSSAHREATPLAQPVVTQNESFDTAMYTSDNAKELGGFVFDVNGNLINNTGNVILDKAAGIQKLKELQSRPTVQPVNTEAKAAEPVYYINEDTGDLVQEDGTLVKKKGDYTEDKDGVIVLKPESRLKSVLDYYTEKGFDFKDANGASLEFTDDGESIKALTEYVANKSYETKFKQTIEQMPEVKALMEHIITGKNPLDFYQSKLQTPDYSNLQIDEANPNQVKLALLEYYTKVSNLDETSANAFIKMAIDSGQSKELVKVAVDGLKNWSINNTKYEETERVNEVQRLKESTDKHWTGVREIVMKGKLEDIAIPENERQSFFDFIGKDSGNGKTKAISAYETLATEQRLKIDYFLFKGLNLDTVVKKAIQTQQVDNLRRRLAKVTTESSIPTTRINNPKNYDNLRLNNIV